MRELNTLNRFVCEYSAPLMDHVVYILGAGFSAPLGLPVMTNFLHKAKDLQRDNPENFVHFDQVFETIDAMAVCKNYFQTDLFNIEEILSILEMQERLSNSARIRRLVAKFIIDVIKGYTRELPNWDALPSNWEGLIFGREERWKLYGAFISSLFNLRYAENIDDSVRLCYDIHPEPKAYYSIISLNYDTLPEKICAYIQTRYPATERHINFRRDFSKPENPNALTVPLAKLHGCAEREVIVAPTWNKTLEKEVMPAWEEAYKLLGSANHIRIIGYSLPPSDAYIKYLFRASVLKAKHLKSIDVICLDPSGTLKEQYAQFIDYKFSRFANADVLDLMRTIVRRAGLPQDGVLSYGVLEDAHHEFMEQHRSA